MPTRPRNEWERLTSAAAAVRERRPRARSQAHRVIETFERRPADDAGCTREQALAWVDFVRAFGDAFWDADEHADEERPWVRRAIAVALRYTEACNAPPYERCCSDLVWLAYAAPTYTDGLELLRFALFEAIRARLAAEDIGTLWYRYAQRMDTCAQFLHTFRAVGEFMAEVAGASRGNAHAAAPVLAALQSPALARGDVSVEATVDAYRWTFALAAEATRTAAQVGLASFLRKIEADDAEAIAARVAESASDTAKEDALHRLVESCADAASLPAWATRPPRV